ncbi:MAG: hypothetical protein KGL53_11715 [Elusimicrobia bacterium]|nr:hypothetical protein [Elusimicrobiota bacterium]
MDKRLQKGGDAPRSRTWSFSLSVTRQDPDGGGETAFSWVKRLTPLDLAVAAALVLLLVVEPLGAYLYLTRRGGLVSVETCQTAGAKVVVVNAPAGPVPAEAGGDLTPGHAVGAQTDVITPLNARDPSALVMGVSEPPPVGVVAGEGTAWDAAIKAAADGVPAAPTEPLSSSSDAALKPVKASH